MDSGGDGGGDFGGDAGGSHDHGGHSGHFSGAGHHGSHTSHSTPWWDFSSASSSSDAGYYGGGDSETSKSAKNTKNIKNVSVTDAVKANFGKEVSVLSKLARSVVTLGSIVLISDGVKKVFQPEDKSKNANFLPAAVEVGVGLGMAYGALVHGGVEKIRRA